MDFYDRLLAAVKKFDGVTSVRIEHGGSRGSASRFRRHPHLTADVNGNAFKFPLKGRPKDRCRGYFLDYLRDIRRKIQGLQDVPTTATHKRDAAVRLARKTRKGGGHVPRVRIPNEPPRHTRLSDNPFAALAQLDERMDAKTHVDESNLNAMETADEHA